MEPKESLTFMTEEEWNICKNPTQMLSFLTTGSTVCHKTITQRKFKLLVCALRRSGNYWFDENDKWEDDSFIITNDRLESKPEETVFLFCRTDTPSNCSQETASDLIRHIIGNPFRPPLWKNCSKCFGNKRCLDAAGDVDDCPRCYNEKTYESVGWFPVETPNWSTDILRIAETCYKEAVPNTKHCDCGGIYVTFKKDHLPLLSICRDCRKEGPFYQTIKQLPNQPIFALRDALLEFGQPQLADHFVKNIRLVKKQSGNRCPKCNENGFWRHGVGFEHEKICMNHDRDVVGGSIIWEPGKETEWQECNNWHPRGCWVLDFILEKS